MRFTESTNLGISTPLTADISNRNPTFVHWFAANDAFSAGNGAAIAGELQRRCAASWIICARLQTAAGYRGGADLCFTQKDKPVALRRLSRRSRAASQRLS